MRTLFVAFRNFCRPNFHQPQNLPMSIGSWLRFGANWLVPVLLSALYIPAIFLTPSSFLTPDFAPISPRSPAPPDLWSSTPPTARALGPQLGGWVLCYAFFIASFLLFENTPRTHQLVSKTNCIIMLVLWPAIWYGGIMPNADFSMAEPEIFIQLSMGEVGLGLIYFYTGFLVPLDPDDEKTQPLHPVKLH